MFLGVALFIFWKEDVKMGVQDKFVLTYKPECCKSFWYVHDMNCRNYWRKPQNKISPLEEKLDQTNKTAQL